MTLLRSLSFNVETHYHFIANQVVGSTRIVDPKVSPVDRKATLNCYHIRPWDYRGWKVYRLRYSMQLKIAGYRFLRPLFAAGLDFGRCKCCLRILRDVEEVRGLQMLCQIVSISLY